MLSLALLSFEMRRTEIGRVRHFSIFDWILRERVFCSDGRVRTSQCVYVFVWRGTPFRNDIAIWANWLYIFWALVASNTKSKWFFPFWDSLPHFCCCCCNRLDGAKWGKFSCVSRNFFFCNQNGERQHLPRCHKILILCNSQPEFPLWCEFFFIFFFASSNKYYSVKKWLSFRCVWIVCIERCRKTQKTQCGEYWQLSK